MSVAGAWRLGAGRAVGRHVAVAGRVVCALFVRAPAALKGSELGGARLLFSLLLIVVLVRRRPQTAAHISTTLATHLPYSYPNLFVLSHP